MLTVRACFQRVSSIHQGYTNGTKRWISIFLITMIRPGIAKMELLSRLCTFLLAFLLVQTWVQTWVKGAPHPVASTSQDETSVTTIRCDIETLIHAADTAINWAKTTTPKQSHAQSHPHATTYQELWKAQIEKDPLKRPPLSVVTELKQFWPDCTERMHVGRTFPAFVREILRRLGIDGVAHISKAVELAKNTPARPGGDDHDDDRDNPGSNKSEIHDRNTEAAMALSLVGLDPWINMPPKEMDDALQAALEWSKTHVYSPRQFRNSESRPVGWGKTYFDMWQEKFKNVPHIRPNKVYKECLSPFIPRYEQLQPPDRHKASSYFFRLFSAFAGFAARQQPSDPLLFKTFTKLYELPLPKPVDVQLKLHTRAAKAREKALDLIETSTHACKRWLASPSDYIPAPLAHLEHRPTHFEVIRALAVEVGEVPRPQFCLALLHRSDEYRYLDRRMKAYVTENVSNRIVIETGLDQPDGKAKNGGYEGLQTGELLYRGQATNFQMVPPTYPMQTAEDVHKSTEQSRKRVRGRDRGPRKSVDRRKKNLTFTPPFGKSNDYSMHALQSSGEYGQSSSKSVGQNSPKGGAYPHSPAQSQSSMWKGLDDLIHILDGEEHTSAWKPASTSSSASHHFDAASMSPLHMDFSPPGSDEISEWLASSPRINNDLYHHSNVHGSLSQSVSGQGPIQAETRPSIPFSPADHLRHAAPAPNLVDDTSVHYGLPYAHVGNKELHSNTKDSNGIPLDQGHREPQTSDFTSAEHTRHVPMPLHDFKQASGSHLPHQAQMHHSFDQLSPGSTAYLQNAPSPYPMSSHTSTVQTPLSDQGHAHFAGHDFEIDHNLVNLLQQHFASEPAHHDLHSHHSSLGNQQAHHQPYYQHPEQPGPLENTHLPQEQSHNQYHHYLDAHASSALHDPLEYNHFSNGHFAIENSHFSPSLPTNYHLDDIHNLAYHDYGHAFDQSMAYPEHHQNYDTQASIWDFGHDANYPHMDFSQHLPAHDGTTYAAPHMQPNHFHM